MFDSILGEPLYIENLYGEYIGIVNRYQNLNRQSVFCRYLNINKEASSYDFATHSTFDRYNSGIQYDVYDYTPLFYSSVVLNDAANAPDLKGQMFQGTLNSIIYTIQRPAIEDLIIFNRPPQQGIEIFRVDHIRASLNAMESTPSANWFELTLEYAPIVDISKINLLNHYVYSLPMQKYIFASEFQKMLQETERMVSLFKQLEVNFDSKREVYFYRDERNQKIVPLFENQVLYKFLATKNEYQDHFNTILRPYGVKELGENGYYNLTSDLYLSDINIPISNFQPSILLQTTTANLFEMTHYIRLWIWERQRDKYPLYKAPENTNYPEISHEYLSGLNSTNVHCNPGVGLTVDVNSLPQISLKG